MSSLNSSDKVGFALTSVIDAEGLMLTQDYVRDNEMRHFHFPFGYSGRPERPIASHLILHTYHRTL